TSVHIGDQAYIPGDGFKLASALRLHPFFRQRLDFDDNAFLDEDDLTSAFFYAATGGARLDLLPGNHEFSAGYKARGIVRLASWGPEFSDPTEEAKYDTRIDGLTRVEHVVDLASALSFPWGRFELHGDFERLSDPLNFTTTRHIRRDIWTGKLEGSAQWVKFRFEGGAGVLRTDFRGAFDYLDDLTYFAHGRVGYEVGPKLYAMIEYEYARIQYDSLSAAEELAFGAHSDLDTHTTTLGLRGNLTPRLEVLLRAGLTYQVVADKSSGEEDGARFFGSIRLLYKATQRSTLDLEYIRDTQISQLASYQVVDRAEMKVRYAWTFLITSVAYGYVENTAPSRGDGFLRYGVGLQIEYRMTRWLATGLSYDWQGRDTEIPDARYSNHRASWHVTVVF
ncbi:MAG: hypothetical protein ACYTFG_19625, partial [Planctomycetota bacterium]